MRVAAKKQRPQTVKSLQKLLTQAYQKATPIPQPDPPSKPVIDNNHEVNNPYKPPEAPVLDNPAIRQPLDMTDREMSFRAFVGIKKSPYYLRKWETLLGTGNNGTGFNWASFFLGMFWLLYRKMYGYFFAFLLIMFGLGVLDTAVGNEGFSFILNISVAIIFGAVGNKLYFNYAQGKIEKIQARNTNPETYLQELTETGGTSWAAPIIAVFLFVLFIGLVVDSL